MATDDVKITLEVDSKKAEEQLDALEKATSSAFKKMEGSATSATARMQNDFKQLGEGLIAAGVGVGAFDGAITQGKRVLSGFLEKALATKRGLQQLDNIYIKTQLGVFGFNRHIVKAGAAIDMFAFGLYAAGTALTLLDNRLAQIAGEGLKKIAGMLAAVVGGLNMLVYGAGRAATWVGNRLVAANDLARKSYDELRFSLIALSIGIDDYNARASGAVLTMKEMMDFTADTAAITGVARVEIKRGTAGLLEMNKTYGLHKEQLMQVMDRAAKFAVIMGIPFLNVLQAVEAAMSGNAQRARFMGLALDDASIAHINAANAAGADARAYQVLGAFMEGTNNIAKRFPETLDEVIGQQNRLDAVIKDVNATMGKGARLAWNPMVNIINLYTLALKAVPDEILVMIGFLRESIGVFFQFIGLVLKLIATLGTLFFVAQGFLTMAGWISVWGASMAGAAGMAGLLGTAIVGLRTAIIWLQASMLPLLGAIALVVAAIGGLVWAYTKFVGTAEAAVEQNKRLAESQNYLTVDNKEAQKQIDALVLANEKLGMSKEGLLEIEAREFIKIAGNFEQVRQYTAALKARSAIEEKLAAVKATDAAQKKIDDMLLANEKLGASKERLLEIAAREFSKTGANTEQVRQYTDALKERSVIEEKMAAANAAKREASSEADEKAEMQKRLDRLSESRMTENELLFQRTEEKRRVVEEAFQNDLILEGTRNQMLEQVKIQHQLRLTAITDRETEKRRRLEEKYSRTVVNMKMNVFRQAAGLVRAMAGESRLAAYAVIAIEKGLAGAQVFMNMQVASMRALAELGPIAGAGAAAKIQSAGWASIAAIAATAFVEAGNVGGGGASSGSYANPVYTTPAPPVGSMPSTQPQQPEPEQNIYVTINVDNLISPETLDEIIEEQIVPALNRAARRNVQFLPA